jgi:hypothetical protein
MFPKWHINQVPPRSESNTNTRPSDVTHYGFKVLGLACLKYLYANTHNLRYFGVRFLGINVGFIPTIFLRMRLSV